jgi:hypothetical protein
MLPRIDILVNATYEAFALSDEALAYKEGPPLPFECVGHPLEHRMNPNHVQYRKLHGALAASGARCRIEIESVPIVMLDYVSMSSEDGLEEVFIDFGGAYRDLCLHYTQTSAPIFGDMVSALREFEAEWEQRTHISLRNELQEEMYLY